MPPKNKKPKNPTVEQIQEFDDASDLAERWITEEAKKEIKKFPKKACPK